jgi:hypothetical protein
MSTAVLLVVLKDELEVATAIFVIAFSSLAEVMVPSVKAPVGRFVMVLLAPEIVLLVMVWLLVRSAISSHALLLSLRR